MKKAALLPMRKILKIVGDGKTTAPQTGDNSNETVYALLALAAAGITGATLIVRKRKSEES